MTAVNAEGESTFKLWTSHKGTLEKMSSSAAYQKIDKGVPSESDMSAEDPLPFTAVETSHTEPVTKSWSSEKTPLVNKDVGDGSNADNEFTVGRYILLLGIMMCFSASFTTMVPLIQQYAYFRFLLVRTPNATSLNQDLSSPCLKNGSSLIERIITNEVQAQTSIFSMVGALTMSIPAVGINLVLGSYSDLLGRKKILFVSLMGSTVNVVFLIFVVLFDLNVYLILVGIFANALGGSLFGAVMSGHAYVSDISRDKKRTLLLALMEGCNGLASALAALASGYAIQSLGFLYPTIGLATLNLASLILLIFLPETLDTTKNLLQNHMSPCKHLSHMWQFCKPTAANVKYILGLGTIALCSTATAGKSILEPLYQMHLPFCWNSQQIGLYSLLANVAQSTTVLFSVKLLHLCLNDTNITLLGLSSYFGSLLVEGFAQQDWQLYTVPVVGILGLTPFPCMRSTITKMAPQEKLGTLLSGVAAMETLTPGLAALLTLVYNATLNVFPSAIFFVMASCIALAALLTVCLKYRLAADG